MKYKRFFAGICAAAVGAAILTLSAVADSTRAVTEITMKYRYAMY